tara:strand:+ start:235 stop:435 length:201 start_codon:yes stop_codon:yes gene_type:complete
MPEATKLTLDKASSYTSANGWHIITTLSLKAGDTQIKKSIDFTNLNDLPDDVRKAILDGTLSIVKQ